MNSPLALLKANSVRYSHLFSLGRRITIFRMECSVSSFPCQHPRDNRTWWMRIGGVVVPDLLASFSVIGCCCVPR